MACSIKQSYRTSNRLHMELKPVKAIHISKSNCEIKGINRKNNKYPLGVKPIVKRYFFICPHEIVLLAKPVVFHSAQFVDDQDDDVQTIRDFGSLG
jgi:hypothetical protein